eukprot:1158924-Pelagomonas_calceolata.AAC.9
MQSEVARLGDRHTDMIKRQGHGAQPGFEAAKICKTCSVRHSNGSPHQHAPPVLPRNISNRSIIRIRIPKCSQNPGALRLRYAVHLHMPNVLHFSTIWTSKHVWLLRAYTEVDSGPGSEPGFEATKKCKTLVQCEVVRLGNKHIKKSRGKIKTQPGCEAARNARLY